MLTKAFQGALLFACALAACTNQVGDNELANLGQTVSGSAAAGNIPSGLPSRMQIGLFSGPGDSWMRTSGVKWDTRYQYFTKGWVNNWGYSGYDGSWGLSYMRECDGQGFIPAVMYYQVNSEAGGNESAFLAKAQNVTTMKSYFGDFKILMQRVKDFGKPVVIMLEGDGFGFLELQSNNNPNTYAAVAATGLPELAGLPNTVAGWGMAFLQLRKSVGATNAVMGPDVSPWASGNDLFNYGVTTDLGSAVNTVYNFLAPLGVAPNQTGQTFDLLVSDPSDRDADYYRLVQGDGGAHTWSTGDSDSINSRSMNRYGEWLRLWNVKSQKRWMLWQIPVGNSNHRNVNNDGSSRAGYKDFRPEYFLLNGTAHLSKFADAGVIGLLFGAGAGGVSSYSNDTYTDGQLFMKSRAGSILNAGGFALSGGGSPPPPPPPPPPTCSATSGTGSGLVGEYYPSKTLPTAGTAPTKSRVDTTVNFNWGNGAPDPSIPVDAFSARWRGKVQPRFSDTYRFYTTSDDGIRLFVNGQKLIDNWTDHGPTENSGTIQLTAGTQYDIMLEYYESAGGATVSLSWSSAGDCEAKAIIPAAQLYPAASGGSSPPPGDTAQYNFEAGTQAWKSSGGMITGVASSTAQAAAGTHALAVTINGTGDQHAFVSNPSTAAGKVVTFRVFIAAGTQLASVQPYVLQGAAGNWLFTGKWTATSSLKLGAWNTLTVAVPSNAVTPLAELGVVFSTNTGVNASTTAYIDSVSF